MEKNFATSRIDNIQRLAQDASLKRLTNEWSHAVSKYNWVYNFDAFGVPIIQSPNDIWAIQELIWATQPDLVVETGIARGGSLVWLASLMFALEVSESISAGESSFNYSERKRAVLGIDIDIREHTTRAINNHPFKNWIQMIEGSSVLDSTYDQVSTISKKYPKVMVILDSNHTHDHVLQELNLYSKIVSKGCYLVVSDTVIDDLPEEHCKDRPWGPGNSPKTAVEEFLSKNSNFVVDSIYDSKLVQTSAPSGYLKRV